MGHTVKLKPKGWAYFPIKHIREQVGFTDYDTNIMNLCADAAKTGMLPVVTMLPISEAMEVFNGERRMIAVKGGGRS